MALVRSVNLTREEMVLLLGLCLALVVGALVHHFRHLPPMQVGAASSSVGERRAVPVTPIPKPRR